MKVPARSTSVASYATRATVRLLSFKQLAARVLRARLQCIRTRRGCPLLFALRKGLELGDVVTPIEEAKYRKGGDSQDPNAAKVGRI